MKKISFLILGIIIGAALAITTSAYADDIKSEISSMIGKKVQGSFPLTIGGKKAAKDVIVIENTSYLPIRSAADLFGYEIAFDADLGVKLTKKEGVAMETATGVVETKEEIQARHDKMEADGKLIVEKQNNKLKLQALVDDIAGKQHILDGKIARLKQLTDPIVDSAKSMGEERYQQVKKDYEADIVTKKAEIDDLNNQLIELNKTITP
jgi:hypothetical protein